MTHKLSILLVEDEKNICDFISTSLSAQDYRISTAHTGKEALPIITSQCPDLILLDLGLPDMDGMEIIRQVRTWSSVPIIVLSARTQEQEKVRALDLGADDYLPKPFVMAELLARVRALTRRQGEYRHSTLRFGDLVLSRTDFNLSAPRGTVRLVGKEFQICELFLSNPRQLLSPEQLLTKIWGYDTDVEINVVWVNISNLRKKFAEIGAHVSIRSVRGAGYILEETL